MSIFVYIYILAILVASFHTENQMGLIYDMEYILGGNQGRCYGITIKICETLNRSRIILYYLIQ